MIEKLLRNTVKELHQYVPGEPIEKVKEKYGVKEIIKLASNENPLGPSPKAIEAMIEMLKQGQYEPMSVAEMVINLYAGTKGYLADIQVADVLSFEAELLRYVKANYPEIITNIETSKKIDEETENLLKQAIPECVEAFGSTHTLVSRKEA